MVGLLNSELPSYFNMTPWVPIQLYGVNAVLPFPEPETLKIQGISFPKETGFFFLALWKWKTLKHFGTTGSYLQEGEDGISPLFPLQGQRGPQDHQRPGSQAGVGVWALSSAGEGCLTVRHWRIVSRLKNGLNWPAMEKSTAGSFGATCSDLGEVSQEISNSAGFLS